MKETLQKKIKRKANELAEEIYPLTFIFPKIEQFALADQIRRSALSVPSNLYEGLARETDVERKRFINIAYSSLAEFKYQIFFAYKRKYLNKESYKSVKAKSEELSKLLHAFAKRLKADALS